MYVPMYTFRRFFVCVATGMFDTFFSSLFPFRVLCSVVCVGVEKKSVCVCVLYDGACREGADGWSARGR